MSKTQVSILNELSGDNPRNKFEIKYEAIGQGVTSAEFEAAWKAAKEELKAAKEEPKEVPDNLAPKKKKEQRFKNKVKSTIIEIETKKKGHAVHFDKSSSSGTTRMLFVEFGGKEMDLTKEEFKERFKFV